METRSAWISTLRIATFAAAVGLAARALMQSLDTTRTREGRGRLASWLSAPAEASEVRERQLAARALVERIDFCEALCVEGARLSEEPEDVEPLVRWTESK